MNKQSIAGKIQRQLDAKEQVRINERAAERARRDSAGVEEHQPPVLPGAVVDPASRRRIGRDGAYDFAEKNQQAVQQRVTFGITTFDRPQHLARLVDSILAYYPGAKLLIASNGNAAPQNMPWQVRILKLPFNCGLSAARNALVDALETEFLLLLEDDFVFVEQTRIELLLDVLDHDPEVGLVSGAMKTHSGSEFIGTDLERFRRAALGRMPDRTVRVTGGGTPYRLCDLVWNFGLFRREMLMRHRWDEGLKLGEHFPYFWAVWEATEWRVATCQAVAIYHDKGGRSRDYLRYRHTAKDFFQRWVAEHPNIEHVKVDWKPPVAHEGFPNLVVLGVGHSGTSILAKMLFELGWEKNDADTAYAESESVRAVNLDARRQNRTFDHAAARRALAALGQPWLLKDPRFIWTLHNWLPHFAALKRPPALVWITRDPQQVSSSYVRRGYQDYTVGKIELLARRAQDQYELWPWAKLQIEYEMLRRAVKLFDVNRNAPHQNWWQKFWRQQKHEGVTLAASRE